MTLAEHIDALDQMIVNGSGQPAIRSQIAFIGREIEAVESRYAMLQQEHFDLAAKHSSLADEHAKLKDAKQPLPFDPPDDYIEPTYAPGN